MTAMIVVGIVGYLVGFFVGAWVRRDERRDEIAELLATIKRREGKVEDLSTALKHANEELTIADDEIAKLDRLLARHEIRRDELRRQAEGIVEHCRRLEAE